MRAKCLRWRHCAKCQRKVFTPVQFASDAVVAERYLTHKFNLHRCPEDERDERRLWPAVADQHLIRHGSRLSISLFGWREPGMTAFRSAHVRTGCSHQWAAPARVSVFTRGRKSDETRSLPVELGDNVPPRKRSDQILLRKHLTPASKPT
jgi:hypothetical protein